MRLSNLLLFPDLYSSSETVPSAAETEVPDADARREALDTTASWIVEAPAGSGKTGLLMQRYLKLLSAGNVTRPEEVLAITFTRKATAELRTRVLEQLEAALENAPLADDATCFDRQTRALAESVLERDMRFSWRLLENPTLFRIQTIDALCAEIANSLPLLSGGAAGRRPVENAEPLYRTAAQRTLMRLGGSDHVLHNALHTVLLHRDGNLDECEKLLARMLKQREQWAELVPLDRASLTQEVLESQVRPRLDNTLGNIVCTGLTRALNAIPSDALHALAWLAHELAGEPGYKGAESPIAFCSSFPSPPEACADHLEHWRALLHLLLTKGNTLRKSFSARALGFHLPEPHERHLRSLIEAFEAAGAESALCNIRSLPSPRYPEDHWQVAKALFRLLLHALAELRVLFAERAECDFSELSLAAREALSAGTGATDLSNSSGTTLRHLLVDEMQDTSSAQYQLLELLTRSWDGHSQTLFLVGDPKQSIYLFRQARVERFLRTMRQERLGDVPIKPLRLTANFRSQANLVKTLNSGFSSVFGSQAALSHATETGDVPFVSADAVRGADPTSGVFWHVDLLDGSDTDAMLTSKRRHMREESVAIRRIVERWRSKPLPPKRTQPWRIAVLARARKHLAPILAEFQRSDSVEPIPFRAVNVEALGERQEVLDAFALTRALLHPSDRLAWLAVLHAPWCGLGLADLMKLTGEGAVLSAEAAQAMTIPSRIEERASLLAEEAQARVKRTFTILQRARIDVGRQSIAVLVERTWRSLGGDVMLAPEKAANVKRYLQLLRTAVQPGERVDFVALKAGLKDLYAEPSVAENAVDMMTIHTAKGLEWDVVIVPALEKRGQSSPYELLNWLELDAMNGDEASVLLAPIQETGEEASSLSKWIRCTRQDRDEAELKRLLYVACTRAREELHLFAAAAHTATGEIKPAKATLLEAFWPAAQEHFAKCQANPSSRPPSMAETLPWAEPEDKSGLALAASADRDPEDAVPVPLLERVPAGFDPRLRFIKAAKNRLPCSPSAPVPLSSFQRPEGSFGVRAYGNTVHRFLELLSARLLSGQSAEDLLRELPTWQGRLTASFRAEGLPPASCTREATRALQLLRAALQDPVGRWILSPHVDSGSETALTLAMPETLTTLRVDRSFLAGDAPLSEANGVFWIVDYKTTEQGSRSSVRFEQEEKAKYGGQLAAYANLLRTARRQQQLIMLGLYYPAVPRLIHWPA